jgi:hypothetical protein
VHLRFKAQTALNPKGDKRKVTMFQTFKLVMNRYSFRMVGILLPLIILAAALSMHILDRHYFVCSGDSPAYKIIDVRASI